MSEQHVDFKDLDREKRLEVIDSLAHMAINIVIKHPDVLERTLLEYLAIRHEYGYVAFLGIYHAIKRGKITARDDGRNTILRSCTE